MKSVADGKALIAHMTNFDFDSVSGPQLKALKRAELPTPERAAACSRNLEKAAAYLNIAREYYAIKEEATQAYYQN